MHSTQNKHDMSCFYYNLKQIFFKINLRSSEKYCCHTNSRAGIYDYANIQTSKWIALELTYFLKYIKWTSWIDMKGELRKNQILDSGKKLFAKHGYYEINVEDILRDAHISRGTFYIYFKNKEDLFISILEKFLAEWEKRLELSTAEIDPHDLQAYYRVLVTHSFRFFRIDPYISNILVRVAPGTNELFEPYIERFEQRMLEIIINYLQMGIDHGVFRKDLDVEVLAKILTAGHLRIAYYYFIKYPEKRTHRSIEHISMEVYNMFFRGLQAPPEASPSKPTKTRKKTRGVSS